MKPAGRQPLILLPTLTILILLAAACAPQLSPPASSPSDDAPPKGDRAQVEWVYDGDTIEVSLDGRTYDLRYIGVDTPERDEYYYDEAFNYNMDLVRGETVILVRDVSDTDQYGRLLRYVYLPDGTFINAEMLSNGMARVVTFPPDTENTQYFKSLEKQAQEAGIGMWSDMDQAGVCDCDRNLYDCSDFSRQREAQACFNYCMEKTGEDVHHLDGGGDGRVCESLP